METQAQQKDERVYKNMEHALVEAMHDLGQNSPYNDQSVRMRELFTRCENCSIEVNGVINSGPHRFSIFNSVLCGRHSSAEIFERIEDSNRQGAWWKLKIPYEKALEFALEQKSFKTVKQRNRQKTETSERKALQFKPQDHITWNKTIVLDTIEKIKQFSIQTARLKNENKELEEKSAQLIDEISQLKQSCSSEVMYMMETYFAAQEQVKILKDQIIEAQTHLKALNAQSTEIQD